MTVIPDVEGDLDAEETDDGKGGPPRQLGGGRGVGFAANRPSVVSWELEALGKRRIAGGLGQGIGRRADISGAGPGETRRLPRETFGSKPSAAAAWTLQGAPEVLEEADDESMEPAVLPEGFVADAPIGEDPAPYSTTSPYDHRGSAGSDRMHDRGYQTSTAAARQRPPRGNTVSSSVPVAPPTDFHIVTTGIQVRTDWSGTGVVIGSVAPSASAIDGNLSSGGAGIDPLLPQRTATPPSTPLVDTAPDEPPVYRPSSPSALFLQQRGAAKTKKRQRD